MSKFNLRLKCTNNIRWLATCLSPMLFYENVSNVGFTPFSVTKWFSWGKERHWLHPCGSEHMHGARQRWHVPFPPPTLGAAEAICGHNSGPFACWSTPPLYWISFFFLWKKKMIPLCSKARNFFKGQWTFGNKMPCQSMWLTPCVQMNS